MDNNSIKSEVPDINPPDPKSKNIKIKQDSGNWILSIPATGYRGKGLLTIVVIAFWMLTILIWSVLLLFMKPIYVLYSVPFWLIGIVTLLKSVKMMNLEQVIEIHHNSIRLKMKRGNILDEKEFKLDEVVIKLVEGSYYTYSGLSKRGQYPAIIKNNEAFGFAERLSIREKQWLVGFINTRLYTRKITEH